MRVKRRSPSFTIVSERSKGSLAYIFPPAKWQGVHLWARIGATSDSNALGVAARRHSLDQTARNEALKRGV